MENRLSSLIFPNRCPYCTAMIRRDMTECAACRAHFPLFPRIELVPAGAVCTAPFTYESTVRDAIIRFKFHNKRRYAESFARLTTRAVCEVYKDMKIDLITAVPLVPNSRRLRGYNQAELIARKMSGLLNIDYGDILVKKRQNNTQHNLEYPQRSKNVDGAYEVKNAEIIEGKTVLLVDDIMTTGSTLSECCTVLNGSGAKRVLCAVVAMGKECR